MMEYEVVSKVRRSVLVGAESESDAIEVAFKLFEKDKFHKKTTQEFYETEVRPYNALIPKQVVLSGEEYERLLKLVASIGNVYRKYDDGSYHNFNRKITLLASELDTITHIENMFWEDIKGKLNLK